MKNKLFIAIVFAALFIGTPAQAQLTTMGIGPGGFGVPSGTGCSQSATFLARTSGLSGTQITAYQNLICGMVTDGTWTLMDGLWMFATNTTTTANLNLVSTSFTLTPNGTETFTANNGYTGDASSGYFDTGINPGAAINYTQNSGSLGSCILNSRTTPQTWASIGNSDFTKYSYIYPYWTGGLIAYEINSHTFPSFAASNSQGSLIASRTSSSVLTLYKNGSSIATPVDTSIGVSFVDMFIGAYNLGGTAADYSGDLIASAFISSGVTPTQAANIYSREHTFFVAVGAASGC